MKRFKNLKDIKETMPREEQIFFDKFEYTPDVEWIWDTNQGKKDRQPISLREVFKDLKGQHKTKILGIAEEIGCSDGLVYKIFEGKRQPSREMLIAIAVAMRLKLWETWTLLHCANYRALYVLNLREAVIAHGIMHGKSLGEINKILAKKKQPLIIPCAHLDRKKFPTR